MIILGGAAGNALSISRSLGRLGVEVHLLVPASSPVASSRYAHRLDYSRDDSREAAWTRFLLGPVSEPLRGAVLLACSDPGIEILIEHREELERKFILDISDSDAQRSLLDKLTTYQAARDAGIPTPLFWTARSADDVYSHRHEYVYPLLVKPQYSHRFQPAFGGAKFFRVGDFDQLLRAYQRANERGLDVLLLEEIPGPDDRLCSYYTYVDEDGVPLFDFTKRVIRRFPVGQGLACYHVTDWIPEARDLGRRLFAHVGLLGLGNVEFKRDDRDGQLKVIECNARFTAANVLLARAGYDLGIFVYSRLADRPAAPLADLRYVRGLHLWYPGKDLRAFLALRASDRMTLRAWVVSLLHRQVLPYFDARDPLPSLHVVAHMARRALELAARGQLHRRPSDDISDGDRS